ncbi:MAG TPA: cytochrome b/b6 domain-containing protein [Candidatus Binataceae bacterium]|nr:cytochrome b/b6 domain-containing protein [Candidatus Binataceae bacterium]
MNEYVIRFSVRQRIEHLFVMLLFVVLGLSGLAQKFFEAQWAQWVIAAMGGIHRVRWVHRGAGILFAAVVAAHIAAALVLVISKRTSPSMVITRKDFRDAVMMMRYYLRVSDEQARFDRYDYRQKFEYWGMVVGSLLMIVTGLMLFFPVLTTRFLPGEFIPAARTAHSNEGLLAFLIVITWHIYNAHLSPDVFPFDVGIFTGKVSHERMEKEHPLEYERMRASAEREKRAHSQA